MKIDTFQITRNSTLQITKVEIRNVMYLTITLIEHTNMHYSKEMRSK